MATKKEDTLAIFMSKKEGKENVDSVCMLIAGFRSLVIAMSNPF